MVWYYMKYAVRIVIGIIAFVTLSVVLYFFLKYRKEKYEMFESPRAMVDYLAYLTRRVSPGYLNLKSSTITDGTIRVAFPKGSGGHEPANVAKGGISAVAMYPRTFDNKQATLEANVLFEPGFAFDQGKLGMGFEMGTTGATGGHGSATASSCRIIFRNRGAASCYIYVPLGSKQTDPDLQAFADGRSKYGKEFFLKDFPEGTFKTGVQHKVAIGVKMNTPGNADGECFMTIDNKTARMTGIMWLINVSSGIARINNTALIGGDWTSSRDQAFQMSNMILSSGFLDENKPQIIAEPPKYINTDYTTENSKNKFNFSKTPWGNIRTGNFKNWRQMRFNSLMTL